MLAIVIINWNTKDLLKDCISHIRAISIRLPYEIIIVDNASTDGSREYLSARFMGRKILNSKNLGFGSACNQSVTAFPADAYLFLNTDAFPEKGAVEKLYDVVMAGDNIALVSPQLINSNGSLQKTTALFPSLLRDPILGKYNFFPSFYSEKQDYPESLQEADAVTGACMMVRKDIFLLMKGFDEDYFFFLEETDFCLRCRRRGYKVMVVKDARCVHMKGKSTENDLLKYRRIFLGSQFLFLKKHLPSLVYFYAAFRKKTGIFIRSLLYLLANLLTFFLIPRFRFKQKLYQGFFWQRAWKKAESDCTSIFRGSRFYGSVADKEGYGFLVRDLYDSLSSKIPFESELKEKGKIIKDTAFSLTGVIEAQGTSVNIKLFRNKKRIPFMPSRSERAFYGAVVLESLGIPIPGLLGYYVKKHSRVTGCFLTQHDWGLEVLNFIFDDMAKAYRSNRIMYYPVKKKLLKALADLFRKLHDVKVIHKDLKASNILVRTKWSEEENPFQIYLIDFENIAVDPLGLKRHKVKHLAQLNKSFPDLSLISFKERLYFLKKYLQIDTFDAESKKLIREIETVTQKMFKRKKMKYYYAEKEKF